MADHISATCILVYSYYYGCAWLDQSGLNNVRNFNSPTVNNRGNYAKEYQKVWNLGLQDYLKNHRVHGALMLRVATFQRSVQFDWTLTNVNLIETGIFYTLSQKSSIWDRLKVSRSLGPKNIAFWVFSDISALRDNFGTICKGMCFLSTNLSIPWPNKKFFDQERNIQKNFCPLIFYGYTRLHSVGADLPTPTRRR